MPSAVSEAGTINPSNHSMNSLRSDSISYFVAQIAYRNQRLNTDSKDLHSSNDLLVRNVFEDLSEKTWSAVRESAKKRQAFSVVGVKIMACPAILKRRRKSSVSATFCLSPLPKIGEGLGSGLKPLLMKRGLGVMELCRACPAYKKTINLWINFVNSKKSFTFAHNLLQR